MTPSWQIRKNLITKSQISVLFGTPKHRRQFALIITLVFAFVIAWLTLSPPTPRQAGFLPDKASHFIAFAALALPCAMFYARSLKWIMPLAVMFGAAIELIQPSVGRSAEGWDFLADCLGLAAGTVTGLTIRAYIFPIRD
jgi:VanZ family protein